MNWQLERSMSPELFRRAMTTFGLSQAATARFLNLSERHIARMASGQAKIPIPIVLLLNSMLAHGETPIAPKRPRSLDVTRNQSQFP